MQDTSTDENDLTTLLLMLFGGLATGSFSFGVLFNPVREWMLQYHLLEDGETVVIPFPLLEGIGFGWPQLFVIAGIIAGGIVLGVALRRRFASRV